MAKKIPTSFMDGPYGPAYACLFHTSEAAAVSHSVNNNYRVVDFDYSPLTQKYVMFFNLSGFFWYLPGLSLNANYKLAV